MRIWSPFVPLQVVTPTGKKDMPLSELLMPNSAGYIDGGTTDLHWSYLHDGTYWQVMLNLNGVVGVGTSYDKNRAQRFAFEDLAEKVFQRGEGVLSQPKTEMAEAAEGHRPERGDEKETASSEGAKAVMEFEAALIKRGQAVVEQTEVKYEPMYFPLSEGPYTLANLRKVADWAWRKAYTETMKLLGVSPGGVCPGPKDAPRVDVTKPKAEQAGSIYDNVIRDALGAEAWLPPSSREG